MSPKRVSEFNVQRSSLMIPRRPYFALVAALLMVWALALVLCLSSLLFQERPNDSENISRVRLWNSVNNILEEVISEHLARRNPHVPSASGTSHRMSRDTIARTAAFQDSLGFNEKQEWEKQLPFRFSKRGPKISNRRQKQSSSSTSANTTALAAKFCSVLSSKKTTFCRVRKHLLPSLTMARRARKISRSTVSLSWSRILYFPSYLRVPPKCYRTIHSFTTLQETPNRERASCRRFFDSSIYSLQFASHIG